MNSFYKRLFSLAKNHPIPLFVLIIILIGIIIYFSPFGPIWAHRIWLIALIGGGSPIVFHTIKGMLKGQFASDIVAMLAIITALFLNEAFAGAVVVLMQSGGEAIEKYGMQRATSSLEELFKGAPHKARRKKGEKIEEIDVEQVEINDTLLVRPGEMIPVDGIVTSGNSQIDESAITGEPLGKEKQKGDLLLSGSINITGAIEMTASKKSSESQYAKIVELVQKAQAEKAPIQRLADRYAVFFTPLTLIMAFIGYLITGQFVTLLAVLVVATPCPLILATPLAVICGINRAAKEGIIVKGGAPIEQIAETKTILFDKTGTITFGTPEVEKIIPLNQESENDLLYHAASLEQFSSHSIAKAIVKKGLEQSSQLAFPTNFQEVPGQGISGEMDGHKYAAGSIHMYQKDRSQLQEKIAPFLQKGSVPIYIMKDGGCIGILLLSDQIRPEASNVIDSLHSIGIDEIKMITGDNKQNAEAIAAEAKIQDVFADLLPEQKVDIVKKCLENKKVLSMVGDGINDAPALASATVGIAMGAHGTAISAEAADIVLLIDDLTKVVEAIHIGKRMLFIAKQSIFIGIGLSFSLMVIAALGKIPPPVGALLQEIIDVTVILNALRVLKK